MLVLSRKKDEWIDIDGLKISIVVVAIDRDKVRLGIVAAKDIAVHRREVRLAIEAQGDKRARQQDQTQGGDAPQGGDTGGASAG